jgi:hypothetical protein
VPVWMAPKRAAQVTASFVAQDPRPALIPATDKAPFGIGYALLPVFVRHRL